MQVRSIVATLKKSTILPVLLGEFSTSDGARWRSRGYANLVATMPLMKNPSGVMPEWGPGGIVRASPIFQRERLNALGGYIDDVFGLLAILPGLSFRASGFPMPRRLTSPNHKPHRLIWSGGEGLDVVSWTWGSRKDPGHVQLFALRNRQHIIAADEHERMVKVSYDGGLFTLERGSEEYLITHVLGRAERARHQAELQWCRQVLEEIGRPDLIQKYKLFLYP